MAGNVLHETSARQAPSIQGGRWFVKLGQGFFPRDVESQPAASPTYAGWVALRLAGAVAGTAPASMRVQVRKRGVVLCGRVIEAAPGREAGDSEWFKVDSYLGQSWFSGENVRLCGGNGCSCEGEAAEAAKSARACAGAAAASAVPLGNTGTTTEGGAR